MKDTKKEINLFLFKPVNAENFGEYLCKKIINEMGFELNNYSDTNPIPNQLDYILTGIGGFFNEFIYHTYLKGKFKKWYIWGNGVDCIPKPNWESRVPDDVVKNDCVITLLRGPLTKEYYGIEEDILLGDPGYLASYFFKFPEEKKKNVLIKHHYDITRKDMDNIDVEFSCLMKPDEYGDIDNKFLTILKSIAPIARARPSSHPSIRAVIIIAKILIAGPE